MLTKAEIEQALSIVNKKPTTITDAQYKAYSEASSKQPAAQPAQGWQPNAGQTAAIADLKKESDALQPMPKPAQGSGWAYQPAPGQLAGVSYAPALPRETFDSPAPPRMAFGAQPVVPAVAAGAPAPQAAPQKEWWQMTQGELDEQNVAAGVYPQAKKG